MTQIENLPIDSLKGAPYNPRKMPDPQMAKLMKGLAEFGMVEPIIVNDRSGLIVGGHQRWEAAKRLGWDKVPVVHIDLDDAKEKALNLALNKISGEFDFPKLAELLQELDSGEIDFELTGFDLSELEGIVNWSPEPEQTEGKTDPDDVPEPPKEPITRPGCLWKLGRHRLLCGDCREPADVSRLMGGRQINIAVTSPPYASQRKYDESSGFKPIPPDEYVNWFFEVQANVNAHLAADGSWFVNIKEHCEDGQRHLYVKDLTIAHVRKWGWRFVDEFCWRDTKNGIPGGWSNRFKDAWEPVFQFCKKQQIKFRPAAVSIESSACFDYRPETKKSANGSGLKSGAPAGGMKQGMARPSNVLEIAAANGQDGHSAAYPVGLPEFFIKAYSDTDDAIYDPFMGSGTTLIAAEKLGRTCYGIELSPNYCDIIVRRWEQFTGKKAELEA